MPPLPADLLTGLDPRNGPGATDIGTFNTISGTSMAAPHIAGIVAQLFQANPAATPAQVEEALKTTAYKYTDGAAYEQGALGTTSFDKGYGLVDVVAAGHGGALSDTAPQQTGRQGAIPCRPVAFPSARKRPSSAPGRHRCITEEEGSMTGGRRMVDAAGRQAGRGSIARTAARVGGRGAVPR